MSIISEEELEHSQEQVTETFFALISEVLCDGKVLSHEGVLAGFPALTAQTDCSYFPCR